MDAMLLAQAAVAALAPVLLKGGEEFAKQAGEAAFAQAKALWALLRGRGAADPASAAALDALEAAPQAPASLDGAGQALGALLAKDDSLRSDIERRLGQLQAALASNVNINVHGGGQVGQIVNVGHVAGNVQIGRPD